MFPDLSVTDFRKSSNISESFPLARVAVYFAPPSRAAFHSFERA